VDRLQDFLDFFNRFSDFEPQEAQGEIVAEQGDEKKFGQYLAEMDVLLFAFMEQQGKLALPDDFRHGADRAEISSRQSGQRIDVVLVIAVIEAGDDIAGHVDQENTVDTDINQIRLQYLVDIV
jgi:hypothetical protein